jgi:23S rRNA-/tRNA-specific pseudouridylate synthase
MLFSTFISGILLCAKTKLAKTKLAAYFAEGTSLVGSGNLDQECGTGRKLSKIYRALADGIVEEDEARPFLLFVLRINIKYYKYSIP